MGATPKLFAAYPNSATNLLLTSLIDDGLVEMFSNTLGS